MCEPWFIGPVRGAVGQWDTTDRFPDDHSRMSSSCPKQRLRACRNPCWGQQTGRSPVSVCTDLARRVGVSMGRTTWSSPVRSRVPSRRRLQWALPWTSSGRRWVSSRSKSWTRPTGKGAARSSYVPLGSATPRPDISRPFVVHDFTCHAPDRTELRAHDLRTGRRLRFKLRLDCVRPLFAEVWDRQGNNKKLARGVGSVFNFAVPNWASPRSQAAG